MYIKTALQYKVYANMRIRYADSMMLGFSFVEYLYIMRSAQELLIENLRAIRLSQNLTQVQLAEKADLSNTIIGDIEQGRRRPGLQTLEKIANALNVPIAQLFYDSQSNYTPAGIENKEELRAFLYRLVDKAIDE